MRIIAGFYRGRQLVAPKQASTRPMTDKVRAALFDALGDLDGSIVVDAYSGSGAVGFEALSRGAAQVVFIESSWQGAKAIKANRQELNLGWGITLKEMTLESWLKQVGKDNKTPYDLIIADPPYDKIDMKTLSQLARLLLPGGRMVVSHSSHQSTPPIEGLKKAQTKAYGDSALSFYKKP